MLRASFDLLTFEAARLLVPLHDRWWRVWHQINAVEKGPPLHDGRCECGPGNGICYFGLVASLAALRLASASPTPVVGPERPPMLPRVVQAPTIVNQRRRSQYQHGSRMHLRVVEPSV